MAITSGGRPRHYSVALLGWGCRQVGVTMTTIEIFAWLLIGHAIADYPLQSEWVARAKQPGFTFGGEAILAQRAGLPCRHPCRCGEARDRVVAAGGA